MRVDWSHVGPVIGRYEDRPAECNDYDPRSPAVAALIAEAVNRHLPEVVVEHAGSTSVPGCAGKGIIDLLVLYPDGALETTKALLDALGFRRQTGRDPWPESRPMRKGSIIYDGTTFRIHAHVIAADAPELAEWRLFRDRLRTDAGLMADYVACKRRIIASNVTDTYDYTMEKGEFIKAYLR
jgi:GrpB-like predicted nucleotidyltransferase (UPF0157 family)